MTTLNLIYGGKISGALTVLSTPPRPSPHHAKNEVARPGYHAERDAYLLREFGLKVVHFTDVEIKSLTRGKVA